jgi:hypothetical protein
MIKVESQLIKERGIVAFRFESSSAADLPALDLLVSCLYGKQDTEVAYTSSNVVLAHFRGMPADIFEDPHG